AAAVEADALGIGDPARDRPVDAGDEVVVHLAAPLAIGGGHEGLAEAGRASIVDAQHRVAAIGEPLVRGIESPLVAEIRPAVNHQDPRDLPPPAPAPEPPRLRWAAAEGRRRPAAP